MIPIPVLVNSRARFLHRSPSVFVAKRDTHRRGSIDASDIRCIFRLQQRIVKPYKNNGSWIAYLDGHIQGAIARGLARHPTSRDQSKNLLPRLLCTLCFTHHRDNLPFLSPYTFSVSYMVWRLFASFPFCLSFPRILCVCISHAWMAQE